MYVAAEEVTKVRAICVQCGDLANYSYRIVDDDNKILLGEKNKYEARCKEKVFLLVRITKYECSNYYNSNANCWSY